MVATQFKCAYNLYRKLTVWHTRSKRGHQSTTRRCRPPSRQIRRSQGPLTGLGEETDTSFSWSRERSLTSSYLSRSSFSWSREWSLTSSYLYALSSMIRYWIERVPSWTFDSIPIDSRPILLKPKRLLPEQRRSGRDYNSASTSSQSRVRLHSGQWMRLGWLWSDFKWKTSHELKR